MSSELLLSSASEVETRIKGLGFREDDARTLAEHFLDAETRGKRGHGLSRVDWLATLPELEPAARPERLVAEAGFERWVEDGRRAASIGWDRDGSGQLAR